MDHIAGVIRLRAIFSIPDYALNERISSALVGFS